jgi:phosphotransferase system HPr (HPr) family protein
MYSEEIKFPYCISGRIAHSLVYSINALGHSVYFQKGDRIVNAGSIIGILSLDVRSEEAITVSILTEDEEEAKKCMAKLKKILLT